MVTMKSPIDQIYDFLLKRRTRFIRIPPEGGCYVGFDLYLLDHDHRDEQIILAAEILFREKIFSKDDLLELGSLLLLAKGKKCDDKIPPKGTTVIVDLPNGKKFLGKVSEIGDGSFTLTAPSSDELEVFVIENGYETKSRVRIKY